MTMKLIFVTMKLFSHNETNVGHNEIILLGKVSLWFDVFKIGRFMSSYFDFCVVKFDTLKLIFFAKTTETLMPQGFLGIEKERKLQYLWYHNFRSYMVEPRGIEPLSEGNLTRLSPSAVCYLHSLIPAGTNTLRESVASWCMVWAKLTIRTVSTQITPEPGSWTFRGGWAPN